MSNPAEVQAKVVLLSISASTFKSPEIFLEGITSDRAGNLYMVDIPYGRILRYNLSNQTWSEVCQWDGEPNGLALRDDGTLVVADYKQGIVSGFLSGISI